MKFLKAIEFSYNYICLERKKGELIETLMKWDEIMREKCAEDITIDFGSIEVLGLGITLDMLPEIEDLSANMTMLDQAGNLPDYKISHAVSEL
jgi:hypothetical protein